jgi:hypothetical protein
MATRTTESTNTLETFRVNFNGLVDDIGNVTGSAVDATAGDQLNTSAATVVGAINEIFAGFNLSSQISGEADNFIQSSNAETLNLIGGTGVHSGSETTNIVTDITADDTMSFLLNDNITSLISLQATKIHPTSGTFVQFSNSDASSAYAIKFVSPGDTLLDFGSTQGFAAAMSVALG